MVVKSAFNTKKRIWS